MPPGWSPRRIWRCWTKLLPYPVAIQTDRFDLLAYNCTYWYLIDDVEKWPVHERNSVLLVFLDPQWWERYPDFEKVAASATAGLAHADDPEWVRLVERLQSESPCFRTALATRRRGLRPSFERRFRNDRVGLLRGELHRGVAGCGPVGADGVAGAHP